MTRTTMRRLGAAALLVLLAATSACSAGGAAAPTMHPAPQLTVGPTGLGSPVPLGSVPGNPPVIGARKPVPEGPPTRLRITKINVDSPLIELGLLPSGELDTPEDFDRAGWYAKGTRPGDVGPAVIAGHVDNRSGPAVFYRLRDLRPGDTIEVARGGEWLAFRVVKTSWHPKANFPTAEVYGPTPDPQLRLITCGGRFDYLKHSYPDNLVVFAVAA